MTKLYKFDSGLTLMYKKNTINKSTSIDISFDCGARCDGNLPGLSHFCEHMFFSGTDKLSKQEVTKRYFDFGIVNAYTSTDEVTFTASIISTKLADYLSVVQDMICDSQFDTNSIEEEKKVVIQEIVQDSDNYKSKAYDFERYGLYGLKHYANRTLGNTESVNSITRKDVKNYVKKYFVKNNCFITICSALSFSKVKNIVKKYFDAKMPSNNVKPLPYMQEKFVKGNNVQLHKEEIGKNFVTVFLKNSQTNLDVKHRILLDACSSIINGIGSGISKELRIENSLVYSVDAYYIINKVNSGFVIATETSKENIKPCLDIIFDYLAKLKQSGFTKEQFDKDQEKNEYYWQTRVISPSYLTRHLSNIRLYGRYVSVEEIYQEYKKITLDEINNFIKKCIAEAEVLVSVYGDADKKHVYTLKQIEKMIGGKLC